MKDLVARWICKDMRAFAIVGDADFVKLHNIVYLPVVLSFIEIP